MARLARLTIDAKKTGRASSEHWRAAQPTRQRDFSTPHGTGFITSREPTGDAQQKKVDPARGGRMPTGCDCDRFGPASESKQTIRGIRPLYRGAAICQP